MVSGGLMQLMSYGAQDIYLINPPHINNYCHECQHEFTYIIDNTLKLCWTCSYNEFIVKEIARTVFLREYMRKAKQMRIRQLRAIMDNLVHKKAIDAYIYKRLLEYMIDN